MTKRGLSLLCFFAVGLSALSAVADTLIMKDGTKHTGVFMGATARTISFKEGKTILHYKVTSVESLEFGPSKMTGVATQPAPTVARSTAKTVVVPAGTELAVRTNEKIDSKVATEGQTFSAGVDEDVMNGAGQVEIPKGSEAQLIIRRVSGGGVTGTSEIALDLQSITVRGRRYEVNTADVEQKGNQGIGANRRTAEMVGGGAALGTLIGAIAGHGKGAAIGALAGAAAGAGAQVLTKGKEVQVPAETVLRFKLDQSLQLQAMH